MIECNRNKNQNVYLRSLLGSYEVSLLVRPFAFVRKYLKLTSHTKNLLPDNKTKKNRDFQLRSGNEFFRELAEFSNFFDSRFVFPCNFDLETIYESKFQCRA